MRQFFIFALVAMASVVTLQAAVVRGVVIDEVTGEPLIGATVMIADSFEGTATGIDGDFTLKINKDQKIVISYISYLTQELTNVSGLTDLKVMMKSNPHELAAVEVVAKINLESELATIADQRQAIFATQIVGAKELSRKGVGDAEGAVMKVSGVSKQEGVKNVFVRGLGDRYNSTTLNGMPLPSDDPEYKNISLDFFTTDIIQSVNVNKAFYATGASDVGGANIDISSKQLTGDGEINVSVSSGINSQTIGADMMKMDGVSALGFANNTYPSSITDSYGFQNKLTPTESKANFDRSVGLSGGKRFMLGANPITFYAVAAYDHGASYTEEEVRSSTNSGVVYQDQIGYISELTTSYLALANVNYLIGNKHSIDYNFMYVHSNTASVGSYEGMDSDYADAGGFASEQGILLRQQTNDNTLLVNQILTKWSLTDRIKANVAGAYNSVTGLEPDRRINTYGMNDDGTYSQVPDTGNQRFFSEMTEGDMNVNASLSYALSSEDDSKSILKVGYSGRFVNNSFEATQYNTEAIYIKDIVEYDDLGMDDYFTTENMLSGYFKMASTYNWYEVTKNIHSAYADATYEFSDKLVANLGVKYDLVDINVIGESSNGAVIDGGIDQEAFFLPSLNARYNLTDKHSVRLSASKTYTLPQAKELAPYRYVGANFKSEGNPDLLASDNYNVDIKWDWYISKSELLSITGFYKYITDPIARVEINSAGGYLSYANVSDKATAAGVELEFRKALFAQELGLNRSNKLTFGLNGSYIYTHAKVDIATDTSGSQLEGAAPFIANTDLSFQMNRDTRSFTTTLVFNYVSDKVYSIGMNGYNDIIEKSVPTLDFVASAKLSDMVSLSLKAKNLLNTDYTLEREGSSGGDTVVLSNFKKGIDISMGVSLSF